MDQSQPNSDNQPIDSIGKFVAELTAMLERSDALGLNLASIHIENAINACGFPIPDLS